MLDGFFLVYLNVVKVVEEYNVDLYVFGKGRGMIIKRYVLDFL